MFSTALPVVTRSASVNTILIVTHPDFFKEWDKSELEAGLKKAGGRVALFAREAGMSRFWAYTLLKKNGIKVSRRK